MSPEHPKFSKRVLEGIRVIDLSMWHLGPAAAVMLADLGAEVIKVETPGQGDPMRGVLAAHGVSLELAGGRQVIFEDFNRNKKGITVNIRKPEGRDILLDLAEKCDVFLTNYRPPILAAAGLDYESFSERNPKIIYATANAFGVRGPKADAPGLELAMLAKSGMMTGSGEPGMPPVAAPNGVADRIGGIFLAYGVAMALIARERYGIGQKVDTSGLAGLLALQSPCFMTTMFTDMEMPRRARKPTGNPLYNYYRCGDDKWICFAAMQQRHWTIFCRILDKPEWKNDPKFAGMMERARNSNELIEMLDEAFLAKPAKEWEVAFREADVPCSIVQSYREVVEDPQVMANEYIVDWAHPVLGPVKMMGFPVNFSKTPMQLETCAPELGQNTEEILLDLCGYDWDKIGRLKDQGLI